MKPAPIANYLDHLGQASAERAPPVRATSPFRPRSLQSSQEAEPRRSAAFERAARAIGAVRPQIEERAPPTPVDRRRPAARTNAADSLGCARSGQSRGDGGEACGGLRARARRRPSGSVGRGRRAAGRRSRGSPGTGCCRTHRVPAQRIRPARSGPPRRLCRDRREGRRRSRSHSRAFPRQRRSSSARRTNFARTSRAFAREARPA